MSLPDTSDTTASSHPYTALTPDVVQDALAGLNLWGDGRLSALSSYENRVYQAALDTPHDGHAQVVLKFYRPGRWTEAQILEEHAFAQALADAEVPAVPPLALQVGDPAGTTTLARFGPWRYSVSPRCGGRSPELEDPQTLEWIGRFLARLHLVGQQQRFEHRGTLEGSAAARASVQWLVDSDLLPMGALGGWHSACLRALDAVDVRFQRHGPLALLRIHGDCHAGNVLWTAQGPHFVDLDDAVNGPAVQDLWMLLGGERHEMQAQLGALLDGYETFREFDRRELALIEPLRTLRIVQHSAWIARRWNDPAFPIAFPNFESPSYWAQQTMQLHEQVEAMAEEPLIA